MVVLPIGNTVGALFVIETTAQLSDVIGVPNSIEMTDDLSLMEGNVVDIDATHVVWKLVEGNEPDD